MFTVDCIANAQEKGIYEVIKKGKLMETEDKEDVMQLTYPLTIEITNPRGDRMIHELSPYSEAFMYSYYEQLKNPSKGTFTYTYGNRIGEHFNNINQYEEVVKKINLSPYTRRAVMSLFDPTIDNSSPHPPCLNHLQVYRSSNNTLSMTVLFRSHDILMAYGANLYGLTLLFADICHDTEYNMGSIYTLSNNPHIYYERDANEVLKWRRMLYV